MMLLDTVPVAAKVLMFYYVYGCLQGLYFQEISAWLQAVPEATEVVSV